MLETGLLGFDDPISICSYLETRAFAISFYDIHNNRELQKSGHIFETFNKFDT